MRRTDKQARGKGQFLLRRQVLYLSGHDIQTDTAVCLACQQHSEHPNNWLTQWLNEMSTRRTRT